MAAYQDITNIQGTNQSKKNFFNVHWEEYLTLPGITSETYPV
jgi:hypothetical protein